MHHGGTLLAAVSAAPAKSIDDVVAIMEAIDAALPDSDGIKWFNYLYLEVTRSVRAGATANRFEDAAWIARLDVVFANLYFTAVRRSAEGGHASAAWRPLFDRQLRPGVARIQFALAGMNAHINHDLAIALTDTNREFGKRPSRTSAHYRDYTAVNALLERVEAEVTPVLLTGVLRRLDGTLGELDEVIAMWKVRKAREAAWVNCEALSQLRTATVRAAFMDCVAATVGMINRGLLIPTQIPRS